MGKKKRIIMSRVRDFNSSTLQEYLDLRLQVASNTSVFLGKAWKFTIFFPRWFLSEAQGKQEICSVNDQDLLEGVLQEHFGGYSVDPSFVAGKGRRGLLIEENLHRKITVIASRWRGTMRYFQALRKELEECSGEEQILILRQELVIV